MKSDSLSLSSLALAILLAAGVACSAKPDDTKITGEIHSKFSQDSGLSTKQLTVQAADGVVTLGGNVDNDAQREAASRQAASVVGVRTVVNNLRVGQAQPVVDASTPPPAPVVAMKAATPASPAKSKPAPGKPTHKSGDDAVSRGAVDKVGPVVLTPPNPTIIASDPPSAVIAVPTPEPPPPPPSPKRLIIDQGTQFTVRLIDPIDSEKNQTGDSFHATLHTAIDSDGEEALPAGIEATGHIVDLKSAGKFAGQSVVVLQLDSISSGGKTYDLKTDTYRKEGSSRGKSTAEKVGGGAILGGIIGAIAGGGKGAAIGTAAGAGAGGGVQAATKSQQIKLPSETKLTFTLQDPIEVVKAPSPDANRPKLPDSQ